MKDRYSHRSAPHATTSGNRNGYKGSSNVGEQCSNDSGREGKSDYVIQCLYVGGSKQDGERQPTGTKNHARRGTQGKSDYLSFTTTQQKRRIVMGEGQDRSGNNMMYYAGKGKGNKTGKEDAAEGDHQPEEPLQRGTKWRLLGLRAQREEGPQLRHTVPATCGWGHESSNGPSDERRFERKAWVMNAAVAGTRRTSSRRIPIELSSTSSTDGEGGQPQGRQRRKKTAKTGKGDTARRPQVVHKDLFRSKRRRQGRNTAPTWFWKSSTGKLKQREHEC